MIFDIENSLWKSDFDTFWQPVSGWIHKIHWFHLNTVERKKSENYTFFYDSRSHPLHQDVLAYGCRYGLVYMVNISGKGRIIHKIRAHDEDIQGLDWSSETPEIFKGQAHYIFSRIWIYEFCFHKIFFDLFFYKVLRSFLLQSKVPI